MSCPNASPNMSDPPTRGDRSPSHTIPASATPQDCVGSLDAARPHEEYYREKTPPGHPQDETQSGAQRRPPLLPPQGTPRSSKPSTHCIHPKDPAYKTKLNIEMHTKIYEIALSSFQDENVPGRNMPKSKQRKLGNLFTPLLSVLSAKSSNDKKKEKKMYPILVSLCIQPVALTHSWPGCSAMLTMLS